MAVHKPLFVPSVLFVLSVLSCRPSPELPKLFPVPEATLVNEQNKPINLSQFKGHVTVYDFIFTSCTGTCPIMTNNMRALAAEIDKDAPVRFVSITVDPTRDTPDVLAKYAQRVRNDPRWTFLTGDRKTIVDVSVKGFKLTAGDPMPGGEALLHSSKFAVADKSGVIRAYFDGTDGASLEPAADAIDALVRE
jgi:protein SCO1